MKQGKNFCNNLKEILGGYGSAVLKLIGLVGQTFYNSSNTATFKI